MVEGEDDSSSGPERNGRHFLGRLDQLRAGVNILQNIGELFPNGVFG
jgi:hypothetical protein